MDWIQVFKYKIEYSKSERRITKNIVKYRFQGVNGLKTIETPESSFLLVSHKKHPNLGFCYDLDNDGVLTFDFGVHPKSQIDHILQLQGRILNIKIRNDNSSSLDSFSIENALNNFNRVLLISEIDKIPMSRKEIIDKLNLKRGTLNAYIQILLSSGLIHEYNEKLKTTKIGKDVACVFNFLHQKQ